jgi:hypothetical protein
MKHWFSPLIYMEVKFEPTEKRIQKIDVSREESFGITVV